jgi:Tetratricopeptide repeat/Cytochrome c554 and c-prime
MSSPRTYGRISFALIRSGLISIVVSGVALIGLQPFVPAIVEAKDNRAAKSEAARKTVDSMGTDYVGSEACAGCHREIYSQFMRTRMGRSVKPASADVLQTMNLPGSFYSQALNRHYEVFGKDGKLYQSEYETTPSGQDVFRNTQQIQWIIGAGASGLGGIVSRGGNLFEAPLSYYSRPNAWELSPGYESIDLGFNRPIQGDCLACHTGRAKVQQPARLVPDDVSLEPTSIGCENCHGPGAAHLRAVTTRGGLQAGTQIVNPERLTAELENDICMSCHESGDSHALKPGKRFEDFRPGTPLDNTLSIFMVPRKRDDPDNGDHVQHYFEMSMSKCFRASARQLRCATCHDPHVEPQREEAPAYFNAKCMSCHASQQCRAPAQSRKATAPADNCIGCHMPRRDTPVVAHTSLTNHRILARPDEPWPEEVYEQTTKELPDLMHLNRTAGKADDIPLVTLLEAYREISERKPEYLGAYDRTLTELEQTTPDLAPVQLALGRRALLAGDAASAIEHIERSLALDPRQPSALSDLSRVLAQSGRNDEAADTAEKAVNLDPWNALMQKALIDRLIAVRQFDKAEAAIQHYVEVFPEDDFMRQMLAIAKQ